MLPLSLLNRCSVMRYLSLCLLFAAAACAQVSDIHTADGRQAKLITCQGFSSSADACSKQAGSECPKGFKVESRTEADTSIETADFTSIQAQHSIVVTCI